MKIRRIKSLVTICLVVCLTILSSVVIVNLVNKHFSSPQNKDVYAAEELRLDWDFDTYGEPSQSQYDYAKTFSIWYKNDLLLFKGMVESGKNFSGKTVKLMNDIDLSGEKWTPIGIQNRHWEEDYVEKMYYSFNGKFDGQNNTISNIKTLLGGEGFGGYNTIIAGLFACVGGSSWTITNQTKTDTVYPGVYDLKIEEPHFEICDLEMGKRAYFIGSVSAFIMGDARFSNIQVMEPIIKVYKEVLTHTGNITSNGILYAGGMFAYSLNISANNVIENCEVKNISWSLGKVALNTGVLVQWMEYAHLSNIGPSYNNGGEQIELKNSVVQVKEENKDGIEYLNNYDFINSGFQSFNCYTDPNEYEGLDITFSKYVNGIWFYAPDYNNKYPTLNSFIKTKKINLFLSDNIYHGTIDVSLIDEFAEKRNEKNELIYNVGDYIISKASSKTSRGYQISLPDDLILNAQFNKDEEGNEILTSDTINIGAFVVTATPEDGYEFKEWTKTKDTTDEYTLTASFEPKRLELNFENLKNDYSDVTIKTGNTTTTQFEYEVAYGSSLSLTKTGGETSSTVLKYTFTPYGGTSTTITYTIPVKYNVEYTNSISSITEDVNEVEIDLEIKTFEVKFNKVNGSNYAGGSWTVEYGTNVSYNISTSSASFTAGTSSVTYDRINDYYELSYVQVKRGNTNTTITGKGTISNIIQNIEITPVFIRCFDVTFNPAVDENGKTDKATLTATTNPIKILNNGRITVELSSDSKTLTYKYNNNVLATYNANKYYILQDQSNRTSITVTSNTIITPQAIFYACVVTISKTDPNSVSNMKVDGVEKTEHSFTVEYGTIVKFTASQSNGLFTYTYTFTNSGETLPTITYTVTNDDYAMSSELNDNRVWHTDLGENDKATEYTFEYSAGTTCLISPTFELKEYGGNVA